VVVVLRKVFVAIAAVTVLSTVSAAAKSLTATTKTVQAGSTNLPAGCSTAGLTFVYSQTGSGSTATIDHVTASITDANCQSGSLKMEFTDLNGATLGEASGTLSGGTTGSIAVSPNPNTQSVKGARVVIIGS
jgi:hypothetical protein